MADRWTEERDWRDRERHLWRNGEAYWGREDRSFRPRDEEIARSDRGPVFGERETGASYGGVAPRRPDHTGPRYGAGGYTGYGDRDDSRSRNGYRDRADRNAGADIYQERRPTGGGGRFYGDDGRQRIYRQESGESGPDYGARGDDRDANSAPPEYWEFGFGYDVFGRDRAAETPRARYGSDERFVFGRDQDHRGRGPQGYTRSDERISDDVHDRLTEDPYLDATAISVAVKDGEVTLTGTVTSRHAKHHAEHIVEDLSGVKHVQNNLRVQELARDRGASTTAATPLGENSKLSDQAAGKA